VDSQAQGLLNHPKGVWVGYPGYLGSGMAVLCTVGIGDGNGLAFSKRLVEMVLDLSLTWNVAGLSIGGRAIIRLLYCFFAR